MAFVWVQQWVALPVIVEEQMGDAPKDVGFQPGEPLKPSLTQDENYSIIKPGTLNPLSPPSTEVRPPVNNTQFYPQYGYSTNLQVGPEASRFQSQSSQMSYNPPSSQDQGSSSFNLGAISGALPDYSSTSQNQNLHSHPQQQFQRSVSGASTSALAYQLGQNLQYQNQTNPNYTNQPQFNPGYLQGQYAPNYVSAQGNPMVQHGQYAYNPNQTRSTVPSPLQQTLPGFQQQNQQYLLYPSPYGGQPQALHGIGNPQIMQQGPYGRRSSFHGIISPQMHDPSGLSAGSAFTSANRMVPGLGVASEGISGGNFMSPGGIQVIKRQSSDTTLNTMPRGPPRKPKQSGHALWVGNLPPGTTVTDLKDHFSRDATRHIESLFLISKSNCAFVNYRTEESCTAAMHRFHDSRFNGVRLVCRLRRSSAPSSGVPTGPSSMAGPRAPSTSPQRSPKLQDGEEQPVQKSEEPALVDRVKSPPGAKVPEKFFVVKSLTLQDLELSVRNGIWATQSHNEDTLNKAFESAENVYLIFSANKSGEYFGYARMASAIGEDSSEVITSIPRTDVVDTLDAPKSIPTPATEHAPKGRIIDDSARGTIFWEADLTDDENDMAQGGVDGNQTGAETENSSTTQTWGKPFKVQWISTNRLPFYRTRGLRNPWNANREVKIARDGTELETSVGKRLIQMFYRLGPPNAAAPPGMPMLPVQGPVVGTQGNMRPY
ncbi:hypothetical protein M501DRAFT_1012337 [Patellaria atrata CBS 101060]|uniref:YTH domain-containing protein n=1 Tax=Patellaria atrata CBS 101060 TaxID=1346257 RepID=A0A9P4VUX7_9PEZI|nr:hypothetical protein M501DRAFT_1012337 [Patellaria atrata CBS 101060]